MDRLLSAFSLSAVGRYVHAPEKIQRELVRKAIHLLVAFVPLLASIDKPLTMVLLASGTLFYIFSEKLRRDGWSVALVSDITVIASRERDKGHFVMGPVTLGLGAMLALLLYPEPAATVAIYALAFGDSLASLVGMSLGGRTIPGTRGKTVSGSLACFAGVYVATLLVTGKHTAAFCIAAVSTVLEAMPTGDLDNIIIPVGAGLAASTLAFF